VSGHKSLREIERHTAAADQPSPFRGHWQAIGRMKNQECLSGCLNCAWDDATALFFFHYFGRVFNRSLKSQD
jgi:hypothetical protein